MEILKLPRGLFFVQLVVKNEFLGVLGIAPQIYGRGLSTTIDQRKVTNKEVIRSICMSLLLYKKT